jgi:hypothetical protein
LKAESVDREFRIEPLSKEHDRAAFSCGVESLDRYLRTQASQDMRRKANAVFVLVRSDVPAAIVAIDERAARFYEAHGFIRLADSMRLIIPMQTTANIIEVGRDQR